VTIPKKDSSEVIPQFAFAERRNFYEDCACMRACLQNFFGGTERVVSYLTDELVHWT
jgi:hypothetical protein